MRQISYYLLAVLLPLPCQKLLPAADTQNDVRLNERKREFLLAKEPTDAAQAFKRLFTGLTADEIRKLKYDSHDEIAIYAYWQTRYSKLPAVKSQFHPERLIGFIEGRIGVECPAEWSMFFTFHDTDYQDDYLPDALRRYGPLGLLELEPESITLGDRIPAFSHEGFTFSTLYNVRVWIAPGTEIHNDHIYVSKRRIPLTANVQHTIRGLLGNRIASKKVRAALQGETAFIAIWDNSAYAFPLICIDASTGRVKWKSSIWGCHGMRKEGLQIPMFGYLSDWNMQVAFGDDTVAVFGSGTGHPFIEAFQVSTGQRILNFNPNRFRHHSISVRSHSRRH